MWFSPNYTIDIILFYGIIYLFLISLTYFLTRQLMFSILISTLLTLVGSEYYEIPLFVSAYLGLRSGPINVWHDIIKITLFLTLMYVAKVQPTKRNVALLIMGPMLTAPLLLLKLCGGWITLYVAKTVGFIVLCIVIINSPGIGGKKVSTKPNKIKSKKGLL